ncbi:lipopolysaccharide biosynthesis protein [Desulforhopalus sp. 52FAK]
MKDMINVRESAFWAEIKNSMRHTVKSKFVRNVAVVVTGTAGAQAINMAFAPIITRLYGPEVFGLLGSFLALAGVVAPIAALTYPIAIVLPKQDSEAKAIAKLSAYLAMSTGTAVFLIFLFGGNWLAVKLQMQEIQSFFLLIPLVIIFSVFTTIARQWLIRKKQYHITARISVLNALVANGLKTGIGLFKPLAAVLIFLSVLGNVISAGIMAWGIKTSDRKNQNKTINYDHLLLKVAKKYYDFPLYRAPQVFINVISQSLPILMLAAFAGPAAAGFYALCVKLLGLPADLIGNSVSEVFYPRLVEASYEGEILSRIIIKTTLSLVLVACIPFGAVIVWGPRLFGFVFGQEWVIAGEYARYLSFWMFFMFINRPSVIAVPILNLQKGLLIYEFFSTGSKLLALYIGFKVFNDDLVAIVLFSFFGSIAYIALIVWVILSSLYYGRKK